LKLPDSAKIHPVVHVSQLKRALGSDCVASLVLPTDSYQFSVPIKIIQHRTVTQGMSPCSHVLVQWSHMPLALATWEDEQALQQQFPYAVVWGQLASLARGMLAQVAHSKLLTNTTQKQANRGALSGPPEGTSTCTARVDQ
jgi:hypothetical protein